MQDSLKLIQVIHNLSGSSAQKKNILPTIKYINKETRQLIKDYGRPQVIEDCLLTLDIFKNIIESDQDAKQKIIRDVTKNIQIGCHHQGDIIYEYQSQADSIYLLFHGQISLNYRTIIFQKREAAQKNAIQQRETEEQLYEQVDSFTKGSGFGEAQFISGKKRGFRAVVKQSNTIIGKLNVTSFQEVIDNYKLRVYYKKLEMFKKCPLLSKLPSNRLQFIVNNSKPIYLRMSNVLIKSGQKPKYLYLLSKGVVQIKKKDQILPFKSEILNLKMKSKYFKESSSKKVCEDVHIGVVEQGSFIGDCQIALNQTFKYQINTVSEKVSLYACDVRLIISQIPSDQLQITKLFYNSKNSYHNERLQSFQNVRQKINEQAVNSRTVTLTSQQIKIKRKIQKRYTENSPSLIGQSSPLQISFMLQRKFSRLKTLSFQTNKFPKIQVFGKVAKQQQKQLHSSFQKVKSLNKIKKKINLKLSSKKNENIKLKESFSQRSNIQKDLKRMKRNISNQAFIRIQSPLKSFLDQKQYPENFRYYKQPYNESYQSKIKNLKESPIRKRKEINRYEINFQKKRFDEFLNKLKQIKKQIRIN